MTLLSWILFSPFVFAVSCIYLNTYTDTQQKGNIDVFAFIILLAFWGIYFIN